MIGDNRKADKNLTGVSNQKSLRLYVWLHDRSVKHADINFHWV